MKDIFIDTNIANKFAKPPSDNYKALIKWLFENDKDNPANNAILMLSDKLIIEYKSGNNGCTSVSAITSILNAVIQQGRFVKITTKEINDFNRKHITNGVKKDLKSNKKDWLHFCLIFLSVRKFGIIGDNKFANDVVNFPKYKNYVRIYYSPDCEDCNFAA
jgi:hypothetical protein